jgi:hypothetical protein
MVEQQPSKLMTRVRFPSPAPAFARKRFGWQAGRKGRPLKPCIFSSRPELNQCTAMPSFQASHPANQEHDDSTEIGLHFAVVAAPSTAVNQMNDGG